MAKLNYLRNKYIMYLKNGSELTITEAEYRALGQRDPHLNPILSGINQSEMKYACEHPVFDSADGTFKQGDVLDYGDKVFDTSQEDYESKAVYGDRIK